MGMDLIGPGRFFQWNIRCWCNVLELGEQYGWKGTGTGPPRGRLVSEWTGRIREASYGSNDGARFYARDAKALAEALSRALRDIPEKELPRGREPKTPLEFFAGWGKPDLRRFIRFCRKGSFRIY